MKMFDAGKTRMIGLPYGEKNCDDMLSRFHLIPERYASNFKIGTQLGFETSLPKKTFWTKLAGVWARGASKQNLGPLRIFATIEASNFKLGTQIGFGTSLPENNVLDQNWRGSGPREHPKKNLGPPTYFCNR